MSQSKKQTILLVGGGTGGHILPLYSLAEACLKKGSNVHLIVNDADLDKKIIQDKFLNLKDLEIHFLKTQKIHYHFSLENFIAPFKIIVSFFRTKKLLKETNPDIVFFKGGFVGFPVLVALKHLIKFRGKIYLHDTDISTGKLTQSIGKKADKIFSNFGENPTPLFYWPKNLKVQKTKNPCPKILIFGGSQGAYFLNKLIIQKLGILTQKYYITLVSGPNQELPKFNSPKENFTLINFMPQDDLIKAMIESDLVICRSGGSMFQVFAAQTPCIAVPLPTSARNHQWENAKYFEEKGYCYLLEQNADTQNKLLPTIEQVLNDPTYLKNIKDQNIQNQASKIAEIITKQ